MNEQWIILMLLSAPNSSKDCITAVHFLAFVLQQSFWCDGILLRKKAFRRYGGVLLLVRKEVPGIIMFHKQECGECCSRKACICTMCSMFRILNLEIMPIVGSVLIENCIITFVLKQRSVYLQQGQQHSQLTSVVRSES
jgi:hypothetical protein